MYANRTCLHSAAAVDIAVTRQAKQPNRMYCVFQMSVIFPARNLFDKCVHTTGHWSSL